MYFKICSAINEIAMLSDHSFFYCVLVATRLFLTIQVYSEDEQNYTTLNKTAIAITNRLILTCTPKGVPEADRESQPFLHRLTIDHL